MVNQKRVVQKNKRPLNFLKGVKQIEATVYGWPRKNH